MILIETQLKPPRLPDGGFVLLVLTGGIFLRTANFSFQIVELFFRALTPLRNGLRPGFEPLIELHFSIAIPSMRFFHGLINDG